MIKSLTEPTKHSKQDLQDDQYDFPYHYLPRYENGRFKQARVLPWGYEYLSYLEFVIEQIQNLHFYSLVDFGCGDGRLLRDLQQMDSGKVYVGVDYSDRAISLARALSPEVRYECCNLYNDRELDEQFDVGTAIETLEHIPPDDLPRFLKGIHSRLKVGGDFLLTVPSKNLPLNKKHFQHFDEDTIGRYLAPLFDIQRIQHLNRSGFLVTRLLEPLLHNRLFVLNQGLLSGIAFRFYRRRYLLADRLNGTRLFVHAKVLCGEHAPLSES